jgi:hypothetical protein
MFSEETPNVVAAWLAITVEFEYSLQADLKSLWANGLLYGFVNNRLNGTDQETLELHNFSYVIEGVYCLHDSTDLLCIVVYVNQLLPRTSS